LSAAEFAASSSSLPLASFHFSALPARIIVATDQQQHYEGGSYIYLCVTGDGAGCGLYAAVVLAGEIN